MKAWRLAVLLAVLAVTGIALREARADRTGYASIVDLRADGDTFIVKHHHDWSEATRASRYKMIATHQDPFRADNDYAYVAWYSRGDGRRLRQMPSPALTWLGVSPDSRYVIGLSNVKHDNPYQLVVYNRADELLLKRHIGSQVACLTPEKYRELRHAHPRQFELLNESIWTKDGVVYVDFMTMDMPTRLGQLWARFILLCAILPSLRIFPSRSQTGCIGTTRNPPRRWWLRMRDSRWRFALRTPRVSSSPCRLSLNNPVSK